MPRVGFGEKEGQLLDSQGKWSVRTVCFTRTLDLQVSVTGSSFVPPNTLPPPRPNSLCLLLIVTTDSALPGILQIRVTELFCGNQRKAFWSARFPYLLPSLAPLNLHSDPESCFQVLSLYFSLLTILRFSYLNSGFDLIFSRLGLTV